MKKKVYRPTKKVLALTAATTMMLAALTGCSGQTANTDSSQQAPEESEAGAETPAAETQPVDAAQETVTINFWHNYSAQSAENETLTNVLIPKFEEENPGYEVNATSYEWADLHDKILISATSDTLPDVARLDIAWIPEFEAMDILVPLDQQRSDFGEISAGLLPSAMSTACIDGSYYALALNTNTKIMYYNAEAFANASLEAPKTTEDLLNAVKTLSGTDENGQQVWGLDEPALAGWNVLPWIWSNGGEITDDTYTQATGYINSEATIEAVQMLADMYQADEMTGFNSGDIPMTDGFGTGRYMMLLEGPWKVAEMEGAYPDFAYATCDVPAGSSGSISVLGGEDIGMFNTGNKEGAWLFMKFMTGEYAQEEMAKCGQIPVNTAALESDTVQEADFAPYLSAIETAKARPPVASWSEIDDELTTAMTRVIKDGEDAKTVLDELAGTIDALLAN